MAGKGDSPRPLSVSRETFESNWDRIFSPSQKYIIYSKTECPNCIKAKQLLDSKQLEYIEVKVDLDIKAYGFLVNQGFRSVPQIYLEDEHIGGYSELVNYLNK